MTVEGTALDLDIAKTSVITYRQRAYQKLGLCSLNELMALIHDMAGLEPGVRGVGQAQRLSPRCERRRRWHICPQF